MTPVFGHGRLRLYLLKLLDESPRHGYEIIRLLQDRFLGLYAPSAGTVYPRLAKLEQEGLVTHSVEGGRKVYRITDAGREELTARQAELDALEAEIRESVYERAREIRDEVRISARNLRDELRQAAHDVREDTRGGAVPPDRPWQGTRRGKEDPVSAWAKGLGPALSQKMVDLAEGLAQGLAGLTEQRAQHLEEEIRKHFGPETVVVEPEDPWREETDGPDGEPGGKSGAGTGKSGAGTGRSDRGSGMTDFERLFDRFRSEINAAAGHAGLTTDQVDRARDVLIRACTDLKDIFRGPDEPSK